MDGQESYLNLFLVRHGKTEGNKENRYIGRRTDEPLCPEGKEELERLRQERMNVYKDVRLIFVSPLLRCRETADILFPGIRKIIIEDLAECDFGEFENKNYMDLNGNPQYQAWIDSGGMAPFPDGESREEFKERSIRGFEEVLKICASDEEISGLEGEPAAAVVTHGGTIMNLMEAFAVPARSFYEWHLKNGEQYSIRLSPRAFLLEIDRKIEYHPFFA